MARIGEGEGRGEARRKELVAYSPCTIRQHLLPFCDTVDGARYIRMQKKIVKEEESVEEEKSWLTGAG